MVAKGHLPAGVGVLVKVASTEVAARQPAASQGVAMWQPTPFCVNRVAEMHSKDACARRGAHVGGL